jgi:nucleotide-binding universal stress UspA family protein
LSRLGLGYSRPQMFGSILVGTDGSDTAAAAVRHAIELCHRLGARLQIVSAYEPVSDQRLTGEQIDVPEDLQWMINPREDVLAMLDEAERDAREAGVGDVETFARQGDAADAILDVAEEQRADLIVVGNRGMTGAKRFLLGSVPNKISHHAPCSVLIVRTT